MDRPAFNLLQAQEVAVAFGRAGVDYLFIGKGAAIPGCQSPRHHRQQKSQWSEE